MVFLGGPAQMNSTSFGQVKIPKRRARLVTAFQVIRDASIVPAISITKMPWPIAR
jgi:hypothetical protein